VVEECVEGEEVEGAECADEEGDEEHSPYGADEGAADGVRAAEAVGGEFAVLDFSHEQAEEDEDAEDDGFDDDHAV